MLADPWFWAVAVPAVILVGLAKGGFAGIGVLAVPLMALTISPVAAAGILLPVLLVQDAYSVWVFRHARDDATLKIMLPGAALGIFIGWLLAARVSVALVELLVGLTAVLFAVQRLAGGQGRASPALASSLAGFGLGAAAGFTSQIAHAGGPPFQMHVLPKGLARDSFIGTSAIFFAVVNWLKVPAYWALGQFSAANLTVAAALLPLALASTWAGVRLVRKVDAEPFYRIVLTLMLLVGGKLIWDGVTGL